MNAIYSIVLTLLLSLSLQAETIKLKQGDKLPSAPTGYKWQFVNASDDEPVLFIYDLVRDSEMAFSDVEKALDGLRNKNTRYSLNELKDKETKKHLLELVERDHDIDYNVSYIGEESSEVEEYCNYEDLNEDGEIWNSESEWSIKWKTITKWVGRRKVIQGYIGVVLVNTWSLDSEEERFCDYPRITFLLDENFNEVEEPFSLLEVLNLKK